MIHNLSWLLPGELAGFGLVQAPSLAELQQLKGAGIDAVVSLTEQAPSSAHLAQAGLEQLHLPVPDMEPPSQTQIDRFVAFASQTRERGEAVGVHCRAGLGRTGTMLAAYLIHRGLSWDEAIAQVRQQRPGSIETAGQEEVLRHFAQRLAAQLQTDG